MSKGVFYNASDGAKGFEKKFSGKRGKIARNPT